MNGTIVNIGKEFSRYPAGRFPSDGKFNGQTFREKFLKEPLLKDQPIVLILDDAVDFGSSFLEEAFGGLVRVEKIAKDKIHGLITFVANQHFFVPDEIWTYVDDAEVE